MSVSAIQFFQSKPEAHLQISFHGHSPEEDTYLAKQFGPRSLNKRKENKKALLQDLSIDKAKMALPLIVIVASWFTSAKERELLESVMTGLKEVDGHILVLADKSICAHALLALFQQLEVSQKNLHQALAAGDMILLPEGCSENITTACHHYGIVPIASTSQPMMRNYDPAQETGNSFLYQQASPWSMFAAVIRALETFKLPYDWQRIQKNGMEK